MEHTNDSNIPLGSGILKITRKANQTSQSFEVCHKISEETQNQKDCTIFEKEDVPQPITVPLFPNLIVIISLMK
jgi:hypothetical protein